MSASRAHARAAEDEIYYPLNAVSGVGVVWPFAQCTSIHSDHPRDRYMERQGAFCFSNGSASEREGGPDAAQGRDLTWIVSGGGVVCAFGRGWMAGRQPATHLSTYCMHSASTLRCCNSVRNRAQLFPRLEMREYWECSQRSSRNSINKGL